MIIIVKAQNNDVKSDETPPIIDLVTKYKKIKLVRVEQFSVEN